MLGITDLKPGTFFIFEAAPHVVVSAEHSKLGRGGSILRSRIRNLKTGAIFDRTLKGNEQFDEADAAVGRLSWVSPLSRVLTDTEVGDTVVWKRPAGDRELEIRSISYPD